MKNLIAILFLFVGCSLHAQDWSCFIAADSSQYFINSDGYLRGMRLDAIVKNGDTTTYYPFHTVRYNPATKFDDTAGGSWLGKAIVRQPDGTFIFQNNWGDTVFIKTMAAVGDQWTMYDDTSKLSYRATVVSVDTMTVLNTLDSVKTIHITPYNGLMINQTDPLFNMNIVLSKHHGFVQTIDLYLFPYESYPGDYYSGRLQGNILFKQIPFYNPTIQEISDWQTGDVFETGHYFSMYNFNGYDWYALDTVITKTSLSNAVQYTLNELVLFRRISPNDTPVHRFGISTVKLSTVDRVFPEGVMPESYRDGYIEFYWYYPNDTSFCLKSAYYATEGIICQYGYKQGIGQVLERCTDQEPNAWGTVIVYSDKQQQHACGPVQFPTSISSINKQNDIKVYPNPAFNTLNIDIQNKAATSYKIQLVDLLGKTILTATFNNNASIPVSDLANGLYLLHITDDAGNSTNEKIVVQH